MMNAQTPSTPEGAPTQAINYSMDEFFRLSAKCEGHPEQVQAVASLFQAKLINFRMVKELLQLSTAPSSSIQE
jgi:hypothetical protein